MRKARIVLAHRLVIIIQNWMTAPIVGVEAEGLVRDGPEDRGNEALSRRQTIQLFPRSPAAPVL